jgi:hypothetical protein
MHISKTEALAQLKKWRQEKQLVLYSAVMEGMSHNIVSGTGYIQTATESIVRVGSDWAWLMIPLAEEAECIYEHGRDLEDRTPPLDCCLSFEFRHRGLSFLIATALEQHGKPGTWPT